MLMNFLCLNEDIVKWGRTIFPGWIFDKVFVSIMYKILKFFNFSLCKKVVHLRAMLSLTLCLLGGGGVHWTLSTFFLTIFFEDLNKKNRNTHVISLFCKYFHVCMIGFWLGPQFWQNGGWGPADPPPPPPPPVNNVVKIALMIFLIDQFISFNVMTTYNWCYL